MTKSNIFLMTTFCFFISKVTSDPECRVGSGTSRAFKMSINSKANSTGEWITTLSAQADSLKSSNDTTFDVTHRITECDGRRVIYIQGVARDNTVELPDDRLYFHPKCGKNIAIIGEGRTVQKINLDDPHNSIAFTNRPLKNDEIFEVRLDKKNTKFSHSLGIGVCSSSPTDVVFPSQMHLTPFSWIMHNREIYTNSTALLKNYGRNLNDLQVGDRVGVMRSRFGALHFFVNGVDQGPAVSNVPFPVYGVFELWNNAAKATIVDRSS